MAAHRVALAFALVLLCSAALFSLSARAEPASAAAQAAELLGQLDAAAKAAGEDCDALAVAIDAWMDAHGEALRGRLAELEETGGGGGDAASGERIMGAMASLGARVEPCGGHAGVASALSRLDAAAAAAAPASAAAASPGDLLDEAPWGAGCRAMLARMDAVCKAHGHRSDAQPVCEAWTQAFSQVEATLPAESMAQIEEACAALMPSIDELEKLWLGSP